MVLMAGCFSWLKNKNKPVRDVKLIIVGLDDAGKTTTVASLQGEPPDGITPTVGFSNAKLLQDKWNIVLYDLGGGKNVRAVWKKYFAEIYGIIFTVDSVNKERIAESKAALNEIFDDPKVKGKPVIIFANKQDKEGALNKTDITTELDLQDLSQQFNFKFNVFPCSALKGYGNKIDQSIKAGFSWILNAIDEDYATIHEKVEKESTIQKEEEAKERRERMERIRKLREEREKAAKEAGVEEEDEEEEDDDVVTGNPFRNIGDQIKVTEKREKKAKEKQKKIEAYHENKEEADIEQPDEPVQTNKKKAKKKKKVKNKIEDEDDYEHEHIKLPKINLKGPTPENSDNDGNKSCVQMQSQKKTKKKKLPSKETADNTDDDDDVCGSTSKKVTANVSAVTISNVIVVSSSENMRDNEKENVDDDDKSSTKITNKKRAKTKSRQIQRKNNDFVYDDDDDDDDDNNDGETDSSVSQKQQQEKINDSRAEMFRARSLDSIDEVDSNRPKKNDKKKKKKKKKKTKKTKNLDEPVDQDDDYDESIQKSKKTKKKSNKNQTVPTLCADAERQLSQDYSDDEKLPPIQHNKLPPLRDNGHVSKLEPIELRGRLPDIGRSKDFNGQPSWYKSRGYFEDS